MRMSLLTNSLSNLGITDLKEIAAWASANGINELDVGPAIPMDQKVFEEVQESGVRIGAIIYCRNFLASDKAEAEEHQKNLIERIRFAGKVHVGTVICSTGVTDASYTPLGLAPMKSIDACVELARRMIDEDEKNDVRLAWENCPVMGNIAVSPDVWEELFDRLGSDRIGLCYDPSHLVWQFIDPYENIFRFKDRIFRFHAKDTHVDMEKLKVYGVQQFMRWWQHRLPGLGDLDWNKIVDSLYQIGYDDAIVIEHEDPVWEGTLDKVKKGILKTRDHVSQYFVE